jgi:methionine synthase I (cobalamin-dependent)
VTTALPHQHGQDHERLWGSEALASAPDEVRDLHRRYVDAGVDVVTTNTWALPTVIQGDGSIRREHHESVHSMHVARRGVVIAREAIGRAVAAVGSRWPSRSTAISTATLGRRR